jgi:hypothetical protein
VEKKTSPTRAYAKSKALDSKKSFILGINLENLFCINESIAKNI